MWVGVCVCVGGLGGCGMCVVSLWVWCGCVFSPHALLANASKVLVIWLRLRTSFCWLTHYSFLFLSLDIIQS